MRIMMTILGSMFVYAVTAQHGHAPAGIFGKSMPKEEHGQIAQTYPIVHYHTRAVCDRMIWNKLTAGLLTSLSFTIKS